MARKRSQWPSPPAHDREPAPTAAPIEMPGAMPADPEPQLPPEPEPSPEPEPAWDDAREFGKVMDAMHTPDHNSEYIVFNYFKQLERAATARAKLADDALAEAAAPPVAPAPPKPSETVQPAPQFKGNRRARKAAARRARQAG
jgi:hypothetical protein